jgi:NADH-quinone oxidoreductase subunit N
LFGDSYVADPLAVLLKLFGFLTIALALLYSREYLERRNINRGEYYVLALTSLLGIFVLCSANSLLTVYIGIELMSLSLYAMVAFDRDNGTAAESAMKYFVLGAIASGMLLYGMSLLYGLSGTLKLDVLASTAAGEPSLGIVLGLVFVVIGVAFKFGAVPFHMWVPDVYHGAPTGVTLFLSTVPKIASFAFAFRLLAYGMGPVSATWQDMLAPLAVLSMVFGNVVAIAQANLKRMLAYSAIGNVGFILLGFVAGSAAGYEAALYYTVAYVIMTLGSFGVLTLASRQGSAPAGSVAGAGHDVPDVLHRRHSAVRGLLGEVQYLPGVVDQRPHVADPHRRRRLGDRRVLLPAHREGHVFRRAR